MVKRIYKNAAKLPPVVIPISYKKYDVSHKISYFRCKICRYCIYKYDSNTNSISSGDILKRKAKKI